MFGFYRRFALGQSSSQIFSFEDGIISDLSPFMLILSYVFFRRNPTPKDFFSHFDMHITNVGNIATMVIRIAMYIEQGLF